MKAILNRMFNRGTEDLVAAVRERVRAGYYDQPEVIEETADCILDDADWDGTCAQLNLDASGYDND